MNLDDALEQTRNRALGPKSNLAKILDKCDDDARQQIVAALDAPAIDKTHWSRALTVYGKANGWITAGVTEESILNWRRDRGLDRP